MSAGSSSTSLVGGSRTADIERDPGQAAAAAYPAECTPGPSHNERTGTRRPGCRDVLPEPSVGTLTVESKRARSTGPTRRWTVPKCARIPARGIAPMCRSGRSRLQAPARHHRTPTRPIDGSGTSQRKAARLPLTRPSARSGAASATPLPNEHPGARASNPPRPVIAWRSVIERRVEATARPRRA